MSLCETCSSSPAPPSKKVNGSLQASCPDVYAIGDVATFPLKMYGGALGRQEHVVNCRQTAAHVAKVLVSGESGRIIQLLFAA